MLLATGRRGGPDLGLTDELRSQRPQTRPRRGKRRQPIARPGNCRQAGHPAERSRVPPDRRQSQTPKPGVRDGSRPGLQVLLSGAAARVVWAPAAVRTKFVTDLLYLDSRTRIFKLLLDFFRLFLVDPLLDRLWRRLDEILRLLQTKAGKSPYFFDYIDLLIADCG